VGWGLYSVHDMDVLYQGWRRVESSRSWSCASRNCARLVTRSQLLYMSSNVDDVRCISQGFVWRPGKRFLINPLRISSEFADYLAVLGQIASNDSVECVSTSSTLPV
jgi:hypothetical protein